MTGEQFLAVMLLTGVAAWLLADLTDWLYLRYGWEWCLHGGALGECQREEREAALGKEEA